MKKIIQIWIKLKWLIIRYKCTCLLKFKAKRERYVFYDHFGVCVKILFKKFSKNVEASVLVSIFFFLKIFPRCFHQSTNFKKFSGASHWRAWVQNNSLGSSEAPKYFGFGIFYCWIHWKKIKKMNPKLLFSTHAYRSTNPKTFASASHWTTNLKKKRFFQAVLAEFCKHAGDSDPLSPDP